MAHVYCVSGINEVAYFNTFREAAGFKPDGDHPQSTERMDAASECNRLDAVIRELECDLIQARLALDDLCAICPADMLETSYGKRAMQFLESHPLPAATASDRDGQRSYAG